MKVVHFKHVRAGDAIVLGISPLAKPYVVLALVRRLHSGVIDVFVMNFAGKLLSWSEWNGNYVGRL